MLAEMIARVYARRHPPKSREQIRAETLAEHDQIGHEIAQRFVRGNINIKAGDFAMREDLRDPSAPFSDEAKRGQVLAAEAPRNETDLGLPGIPFKFGCRLHAARCAS